MTFESAVALVREFGFPVFVSMWFMWRLEKRLERLYELMNSLMQATAILAKSMDTSFLHLEQRDRLDRSGPVPVLQDGKAP